MIQDWATELEKRGATLLRNQVPEEILGPISDEVDRLIALPDALDRGKGGYALRHLLHRSEILRVFSESETFLSIARTAVGPNPRPVKGILFDKGEAANWSVRWHQDTTISVTKKINAPGYEAWSEKDQVPHVRPPIEIMENIIALRIHLDDCGEENGPLKILKGSHRRGYVTREEVLRMMEELPTIPCPARTGDVLLMKPLVVHSSGRSKSPAHRRVLHIEYTNVELPSGLDWFEAS